MSEDPQPGASSDTPVSPEPGQDVSLVKTPRLSDKVVGHLTDQARLTAQGAKARRVTTTDGQPGVADLTPLRELVSELAEELQKASPRERIARVLRQVADIIDPPEPVR